MPQTWDEVVSLCKEMRANGVKNPIFWGWNITGNWFMQALMWSQDEPIVKGNKVNFDGEAGLTAFETMKKIFRAARCRTCPGKMRWLLSLPATSA